MRYHWQVISIGLVISIHSFHETASPQGLPPETTKVVVSKGWNLISLPHPALSARVTDVFPGAISGAFRYDEGYIEDTLLLAGPGYWIKFAAPDSFPVAVCIQCPSEIRLSAGWNLVGSFSGPFVAESIRTTPGGQILKSKFYGYAQGYNIVDTLYPGMGYWVKSSSKGSLSDNESSSYTSADSIEARDFALWLSGNLTPPDSLIGPLLYDLCYIRHAFLDSAVNAIVNTGRFRAPWVISELNIQFDDTTINLLNHGLYSAWNQFEESLRPVSVDSVDELGWSTLHFAGVLNPRRLSDLYRNLPGVVTVEPNGIGFCAACGCPDFPIYPRLVGNDLTYIFTQGKQCAQCSYIVTRNSVPQLGSLGVESSLNIVNFASWDGPGRNFPRRVFK